MAKRRKYDSDDFIYSEDDPIGLTNAFAPIKPDPQSVQYDVEDEPIGLTQAFATIDTGEGQPAWEKAGKWADFDWNASVEGDEPSDEGDEAPANDDDAALGDEPAEEPSDDGVAAAPETSESPEEGVAPDASDASAADASSGAEGLAPVAASTTGTQAGGSRRGRHAAPEPELSPRMKKSKRTRRILIAIVVLLVLIGAALGFFMFKTFVQSQEEAAQQAQEQVATPKDEISKTSADDAVETQSQHVDVPVLTGLFGKTTDDAVSELGRGALVTSNRKVKDKDSAIKRDVSIALTEEPADSKTGTPTVYLGLDKDGKIVQVGYSASAAALGFGSLSFADAVNNEHVIEKTLAKIGANVDEGSATLPDDKGKYTTYASDKTTVEKERCSFDGAVDVDGATCTWSAVLSYDYTTQIVTGNLSDTVRVIYVYITK